MKILIRTYDNTNNSTITEKDAYLQMGIVKENTHNMPSMVPVL